MLAKENKRELKNIERKTKENNPNGGSTSMGKNKKPESRLDTEKKGLTKTLNIGIILIYFFSSEVNCVYGKVR